MAASSQKVRGRISSRRRLHTLADHLRAAREHSREVNMLIRMEYAERIGKGEDPDAVIDSILAERVR
jgi:hypothetical protein